MQIWSGLLLLSQHEGPNLQNTFINMAELYWRTSLTEEQDKYIINYFFYYYYLCCEEIESQGEKEDRTVKGHPDKKVATTISVTLNLFILPCSIKVPEDCSFSESIFFFCIENNRVNRFVFKYSLVCFPVTCCLVLLTKCPEAQSSHPFVSGIYLIIHLRAKMLQL